MNDVLGLAKSLISIPSTKENNAAKQEVIELAKSQLDTYTIFDFDSNGSPSLLVSNSHTTINDFRVILNAHLDVVPGNKNQFQPYEKDGKLFGRGAIDMKAAAAAMIVVFKSIAHQINYPLALQLVTDEEVGGFDGTKFQIDNGIKGEFVLAGEPTDLNINCKAKGIIWATISTNGITAHGAYPWNGRNAIERMTTVLQAIAATYPSPTEEAWRTTINIAKIETSNTALNKVPADCTLSLDIRYIPEDKEKVKKFLRTISKECQLSMIMEEPAQLTEETNPYVEDLRRTIHGVAKRNVDLIKKHGGSDIRHFSQIGCPGVTFGPVGQGMHTDEESVDLQSLDQFIEILKKFLLSQNDTARTRSP